MFDPRLLVGYDSSDDACVYSVSDDVAVIETVDFFTPIVDDPYLFGQIAAANALSDVYAMGGVPKLAMNLLCVPSCLPLDTVRAILEGGHDKAVEAGCVIAGGHTIQDDEPKLGVGVITTALKAALADDSARDAAYASMAALNAKAAQAVREVSRVHACTDVTGFGLLGHSYEMASGSGVTVRLHGAALPLLPQAEELADMGIVPGGAYRNRDYVKPHLRVLDGAQRARLDLAADPQTSGGLLVSLPRANAEELLEKLHAFAPWSAIVGEVLPQGESALEFD